MVTYYVDAAMMGPDWTAGPRALVQFVATLNSALLDADLDVEAEAVTDSVNGAENEDPELVPEGVWLAAMACCPSRWWGG